VKVKDRYIGHIGLYRLDYYTNTIEIDNILREEIENKEIMQDTIDKIMEGVY
jgi:hypothetical protein